MINLTENCLTTATDVINTTAPSSVISYSSNVLISVVIVILFFISTIGNVLTVATISSTTQLQTISNYFICSLCVSDLCSALLCSPLWLYRRTWGFADWKWGEVLCKFYWVSDFTTNYVTALHIASFAAFRYAAVRKPFKVWDISKRNILIYILILWFFSTAVSLPLIIFMGVSKNKQNVGTHVGDSWPSCSILQEKIEDYHSYTIIVYPTLFIIPLIIIILFSLLLSHRLIQQQRSFFRINQSQNTIKTISNQLKMHQYNCYHGDNQNDKPNQFTLASKMKNERSSQRQRKTFLQLILVVFSFMIGYIPTSVYLIWTTSTAESPSIDYWFGVTSYLCLRLSECLNPLMYNLGSNNLRRGTKNLLMRAYKKFYLKK